MNGPISYVLPLVDVSLKVTTDTNPTKGLDRHGLARNGLQRICGTIA